MKLRTLHRTLAAFFLCVILSGCASGTGRLHIGRNKVQSVPNPGTPATLNTAKQTGSIRIPKNSKITRTETAAEPATQTKPAEPAKITTVVENSEPTEWVETKESVSANTGTVDTSVAKHKIDVEDRKWLLWTAIACGIAGLVVKSMLPAWPALSNGLLIASPLAFAAWKLADVPSWLWFVAVAVVGLLALGYKRAEWDKDSDGIPDFLEGKKSVPAAPTATV